MKEWARSIPPYTKYVDAESIEFLKILYLQHHPSIKVENLGGQEVIVDYDNKIIEFDLWKDYLYNRRKKFGWKRNVPAIGVNEVILKKSSQENMIIRVTHKEKLHHINPETVQKAMDENWLEDVKSGLKIFAIPLDMTSGILKKALENERGLITDYAH